MIKPNYQINFVLIFLLFCLSVYIFILAYRKRTLKLSFFFNVFTAFLFLILLINPEINIPFKLKGGKGILVMIDTSQSMQIRNNQNKTRLKRVKEILKKNKYFQNYNPLFFTFDENLKKIDKKEIKNIQPDGKKTSISGCLAKIIKNYGDKASGLIIFTDGQENCEYKEIMESDIPFFCVGIGNEKIKDVRIESVLTNEPLYVGDSLKIDVLIKQTGFEGEDCKVILKNGSEIVDIKNVRFNRSDLKISFSQKVKKKGSYIYRVVIEKDDIIKENNDFPFLVRVLYPEINVFYVDGYLRWDYKFLTRFLSTMEKINPVFFVKVGKNFYQQTAGKTLKIQTSLFSDYTSIKNFHIIIIGDIDLSLFSKNEVENLKKFVENGGGLIFLAGKNFLQTIKNSFVKELLPVQVSSDIDIIYKNFKLEFTEVGKNIPVLYMKSLPSVSSLIPSHLSPEGYSIVNAENFPLLACKLYRKGKIISIQTDSLWKWYISGNEKIYEELLSRILYYLCPPETYLIKEKVPEINIKQQAIVNEKITGKIESDVFGNIRLFLTNVQQNTREPIEIDEKGKFEVYFEKPGLYLLELQNNKQKNYRLIRVYSGVEFFKIERDENYLKTITALLKGQYISEERMPEKFRPQIREKAVYKRFIIKKKEEAIIIFLIFFLLNYSWWLKRRYGNI